MRPPRSAAVVAGLGASLALMLSPAAAMAVTDFPVDNTNDSGTGSLRQAITDANGNPGADTITINTTGTVTLLSALPAISQDVDIAGPGQIQFTVSGANTFQVLKIQSGTVSISGLTIAQGNCASAACSFTGGGLANISAGTVTLNDVVVSHNTTAGQGGGIYNTGHLILNDSLVELNSSAATGGTNAFAEGGGIWNAGTLELVRSEVSQNTAGASNATSQNAPQGGGIFNNGTGSVTLDRSIVDRNDTTATASGLATTNAVGGGVINDGTLTLTRSTVSNNTASGTGGSNNTAMGAGIFSGGGGSATVDRSTVSDNTSTGSDNESGGGIDVGGTSFSITSSTIAHNSALTGANLSIQVAPTLKNTIISNPGGSGTDCSGVAPTSQGFNIADDASCSLVGTGDQPSTNPMLAASLAANGGGTQTYALQSGSPAIDQGISSVGETVDQRGRMRPWDFPSIANASGGDGTDVGAFEAQAANTIIDSGPGATTRDPTPTFTFHSTEVGATFQCKVDGGAFVPCMSPRTTAHLADGPHTFQVRAVDVGGIPDTSAASRSFTVKTAEVKRSGSVIMVTAAPGSKDNLKITRPTATTVRVTNLPAGAFTASGIHVGPGCTRSGDYTANCSATSSMSVNVSSGTATDRVLNMSPLAITIDGGAGNDMLTGGPRDDTITGGPGADVMRGNNGNDMLKGRDLTSDTTINCDGGTTPGTADKANLDLLPKDSAVSGCESVVRH